MLFQRGRSKGKIPPSHFVFQKTDDNWKEIPSLPHDGGHSEEAPLAFSAGFAGRSREENPSEEHSSAAVHPDLPTTPPPPPALLLLQSLACSYNTNWRKDPIIHFPWSREKYVGHKKNTIFLKIQNPRRNKNLFPWCVRST